MKEEWKIGILIFLIITATLILGSLFQSIIIICIALVMIPLSIFLPVLKEIVKKQRKKKIKRWVSILLILFISIIFLFSLLFILMLTLAVYQGVYHCGRGDCFFESTDIPCSSDNDCFNTGGYCNSLPFCNLNTNACENVCKDDIPEIKCTILGGKYYPVRFCM